MNAFVAFFCSASYLSTVAGRTLIYLNNILIGIHRVQSGEAPLASVLLNFSMIALVVESCVYHIHIERLRLFLMYEDSKRQEEQTRQILMQVPANVILVQDAHVVFQNKHTDKFVNSFREEDAPSMLGTDESFDQTQYLLNK